MPLENRIFQAPAEQAIRVPGPELTVIAPSFNEKENVRALIEKLDAALRGVHFEVLYVDDNSPDGTAGEVRALARLDARVRCLQRIGRRGLSSACAEGVLATSSPFIAIIDADLQHDERLLPQMFDILRSDQTVDVVIGSRYTEQTVSEGFSRARQAMSRIATRLAQVVLKAELSDPVSGFFMARREVFEAALPSLSGIGNKILVDTFASSPRPLKFRELPYVFRERLHGESKLDSLTVWEYLVLLADKLFGHIIPVRFLLFSLVGFSGVFVQLFAVKALLVTGTLEFDDAQAIAIGTAAVSNFFLNNWLTYRDKRLRGWRILPGLVSFLAVCSVGAVANYAFALKAFQFSHIWWLASAGGAAVGAVLNYAMTSLFTWGRKK